MSFFSSQPGNSKHEPIRRWAGRALLWIALIAAVSYSAGNTEFLFNNEPIAIEVETPRFVTVREGEKIALMPITAKIRNNTDEMATLEAETPCHVFRWFVTVATGEFVQAKRENECAELVMNAYLRPGEIAKEKIELPLDSTRYDIGQRYILVYRYWGFEDHVSFRVEAAE